MSTGSSITNRYLDFKILNLSKLVHRVEGRGPYVVTQDGSAPGDPAMRNCSFVLTKRGTWLHFYLYLALSEAVRERIAYYDAIPDILKRAESLPPEVIVEDAASLQELIRDAGFEPDAEDAAGRSLMEEIKRRHSAKANETNQ